MEEIQEWERKERTPGFEQWWDENVTNQAYREDIILKDISFRAYVRGYNDAAEDCY